MVCSMYAMIKNLLNDISFKEAIKLMPSSLGKGEAIINPAKVADMYFLKDPNSSLSSFPINLINFVLDIALTS